MSRTNGGAPGPSHTTPLHELRLKHFRSFADSKAVPFGKFTVVFGRNNSGKSTLLQALLLLKQTVESPEYGPRLNTRGSLYAGGSFADLVHKHSGRAFEWSLRLGLRDGTEANVEFDFVRDDKGHLARIGRLLISPAERSSQDPVEFKRGVGAGGPYEMRIGDVSLGGQEKGNFKFSASRFLPLIGDEPPRVGAPSKRRALCRNHARLVIDELERLVADLRAVGAFRQPPLRRYEYAGRVPDTADPAGVHVVAALIEDATRRGRERGRLVAAVNRWLAMVGRVRLMPIRPIGGPTRLYELRLRDTDSGRWANFADVGFGVGQALPVIVEGLRTPIGGVFLVQEPEIHLHPDAQIAMADFLVDLALAGRQVVVETHSEALLLRVRHRTLTAIGRLRRIRSEDVRVVVVDKNVTGSSFTMAMRIDQMGQVKNWPKSFMEDATRERLDLLGAMTRAVEQ